jgi:hypothetical protein
LIDDAVGRGFRKRDAKLDDIRASIGYRRNQQFRVREGRVTSSDISDERRPTVFSAGGESVFEAF